MRDKREFQVFVRASVDVTVEAKDENEAQEKAELLWYEALKYSGDWDIEDVVEL